MITPYYEDISTILYHGDCAAILPDIQEKVQLAVTSPPYDNLRDYGGYHFDFDKVADAIVNALDLGGVLVWVVCDATIDGSETGSSMRQALGFLDRGLKLHDTMIWRKKGTGGRTWPNRHANGFEYMYVFSNGWPATVNIIEDRKSIYAGVKPAYKLRHRNGNLDQRESHITPPVIQRDNVWEYAQGGIGNGDTHLAYKHPAIFPYRLARDHIITWSNPGDMVLDPMAGSGTTLRAAKDLGRRSIGIEVHQEYCDNIRTRMGQQVLAMDL